MKKLILGIITLASLPAYANSDDWCHFVITSHPRGALARENNLKILEKTMTTQPNIKDIEFDREVFSPHLYPNKLYVDVLVSKGSKRVETWAGIGRKDMLDIGFDIYKVNSEGKPSLIKKIKKQLRWKNGENRNRDSDSLNAKKAMKKLLRLVDKIPSCDSF